MTDSMYSILVAINVKPEYRDSFIKASIAEAQGSVSGEPEIFQFQMLVDETNPNRFYFFEIFRDEKANKSHWETDAFKAWWNTVEEIFDGDLVTDERYAAGTIASIYIDAVAPAENGSWPLGLAGRYKTDGDHIKNYVSAAKSETGFQSYLEQFVLSESQADHG